MERNRLMHQTFARALVAFASITSACSDGASTIEGAGKNSNKPLVQKSGEPGDNEADQASLPEEIAGGFLTCSYIGTEETGFDPSDQHMPVGCVLKKNGEKVTDSRYSYKIGLYKTSPLAPVSMDTKEASPSSSWHGYGRLERYGTQDLSLGMKVKDRTSGVESGPLLFPVRDLATIDLQATLNLVGGYKSGGFYDRFPLSGQPSLIPGYGIIPESFCHAGQRLPKADTTQDTSFLGNNMAQVGGRVLDAVVGSDMSNLEIKSQKDSTKTFTRGCLVNVRLRDKTKWAPTALDTDGQTVVEGAGCLFVAYYEGLTWHLRIYDGADIKESGIRKDYLAAYVRHYQDAGAAGRASTASCP